MTIPIIYRALAFLLLAALATGGLLYARSQTGGTEDESPALAPAAELDALEARVAELEQQLGSSEETRTTLAEQVASLGRKLDRQVTDLRESLRDLRSAVRQARSGASGALERADAASARAGEALARADALARDLTVLEDRFNVHMRRNHGGD